MKPLVLIILDGFGCSPAEYGNAIRAARMPNLDKLMAECPHTLIGASGMDVGLPEGQMGNSEVGHTNIGAGRVVYQELTRITKAVEDGGLLRNKALRFAMEDCRDRGTALHLMGLLSDGGVHSHIRHLFGLLDMAKALGLHKIYVHCFLDGRDTPPASGRGYVEELEAKLRALGVGSVADCGGRYYGMDRDRRWDRVKKHYDTLLFGAGERYADCAEGVRASYDAGVTDEFVIPFVCDENGRIKDGDSVVFFNFRPDRAREMTRALCDTDFDGFERPADRPALRFVCMAQYDATIPGVEVAFPPEALKNTFGSYISEKGLCQLRIAETEKYAHVTFFFNGGVETPYESESRDLIPSPKVATYDLQPEMSACLVTDRLLEELDSGKHDVVILNYANCDMVGHTGVFEAAVKACETVDECLGRVTAKVKSLGGTALVTADHGNADAMLAPDGTPFTAHNTNPVPFLVFNHPCKLRGGGRLADIAPTMLWLLGLPKPPEMTGESLIIG